MGNKSVNTCLGMSSSISSVWHLGVDEAINFFATCCFELSVVSGLWDTLKELIDLVKLTKVNKNPMHL